MLFSRDDEDIFKGFIIFFLVIFIPTLIIWTLNFFSYPEKELRYVADTKIAVSLDGIDSSGNTLDLPVDETIYFQVRITVESNSYSRRFFHDNKIPVTITISDPELAQYTVHTSKGFEELMLSETTNNATSYFFHVFAGKYRLEESVITFKGIAIKEGSQQVRVKYGEKVSGRYDRIATLNYTDWY
jgi:hypothetical protein